ncbi:MAG: metalloregulator ArsR/SmtB family transcription factor [Anaerolineae bacterium]|jgi:ArsR family transcriptional regulator|nr:metalloregulator ArsR/SmtB family transcription factor [Anaerolineae bacterium]
MKNIEACQYVSLKPILHTGQALDTLTIINMIGFMNTNQVLFAKALADETRQEIMLHLCCVWLNVNDLVEKLGGKVNQPTVSHHLKKLEEAGLVQVREEGRFRYYTLNQEQFMACCKLLLKSFAPDYAGNMIGLDDIPVNGS